MSDPENMQAPPPGFQMYHEVERHLRALGHTAKTLYTDGKIGGDPVRQYILEEKPNICLTGAFTGWNIYTELESFFVEHDIYYLNMLEMYWRSHAQLNSSNRNHVVLHLDRHLKKIAEAMPELTLQHGLYRWFALGTDDDFKIDPALQDDTNRPIDVLWVGRFRESHAYHALQPYPACIHNLAREVAQQAWQHLYSPTVIQAFAVLKALEGYHPHLNTAFFFDFMLAVDVLTRTHRRIEILKQLDGLNVHVVTNEDINLPNFTVHAERPWEEVNALIRQAKIFICDGPNHTICLNDRSMNSVLQGTFALSVDTKGMAEAFTDGETAAFFDMRIKGHLRDQVEYYLSNPNARRDVVQAAQPVIRQNHGYKQAVDELLKQIAEHTVHKPT